MQLVEHDSGDDHKSFDDHLPKLTDAHHHQAIAQHAGYPFFFWLTVFLGLPALLLLPAIKES